MKDSLNALGNRTVPPNGQPMARSDSEGIGRPLAEDSFRMRVQTVSTMEQMLETIRRRLDAQLPKDLYLADSYLAAMLSMSLKTLANRRAAKPERYPRPLHLGGARTGVHERTDLIDWLAREELRARASSVHRCS